MENQNQKIVRVNAARVLKSATHNRNLETGAMKPGKTAHYYWLETELAMHFSELNFEKGVDLNRDGKIDDSERTDVNDDGEVDVAELKAFLKSNRPALESWAGSSKPSIHMVRPFDPTTLFTTFSMSNHKWFHLIFWRLHT